MTPTGLRDSSAYLARDYQSRPRALLMPSEPWSIWPRRREIGEFATTWFLEPAAGDAWVPDIPRDLRNSPWIDPTAGVRRLLRERATV